MTPSKAIQFTLISSDKQMARHVLELQDHARAVWLGSVGSHDPGYSATETEALARATQLLETGGPAAFSHSRWFLFMPMRVPITVMLGIDLMPSGPVWHLSMSRPDMTTGKTMRVPDMFVRRVLRAFFGEAPVTEGPPEGVIKHVRHFRTPYQPN